MAFYAATFDGLLQAFTDMRTNVNAALQRRDVTIAMKLDKPPTSNSAGQYAVDAVTGNWVNVSGGGTPPTYDTVQALAAYTDAKTTGV